MNLLIIGGSGQLGSALVKNAQSLNYEVIAPSKEELDISDKLQFKDDLNYYKPDVVINTAAYNDTINSEKHSTEAFEYNCITVKNMAKLCNDYNIKFVTFSTDYIFNGRKNKQYIETDIPSPLNMYGLSKLAGEYASLLYNTTTVVRTSTLYGLNRSEHGKFNIIDKFINDSKIWNRIEVANNKFVSSTNAEDLSKSVLELILHKKENMEDNHIYHLVNEGFCSIYNLIKESFNILDIDIELIPVKHEELLDGIRRPLFSALKNRKAKKLGIKLPYWKNSLKRYLETKYNNYNSI